MNSQATVAPNLETVAPNLETGADRMTVRNMPFEFMPRHESWNPDKPEFAHIVNSASLAMPYLEPYLIRSMRKARPHIQDAALLDELDRYIKQEATHYRRHKEFNDTLSKKGYSSVQTMEDTLAEDYAALESKRSLRFNLAYAEGFEAMALAIGQMLIEDREYLFGNSDSAVASLILWHFVEEIEHKNVAFDVFDHVYGSYFWRIVGLVYATSHIFWRTGQGYRALLKEDGLWQSSASRWKLLKVLGRIARNIAPSWLRILKPGYHPKQVSDPDWGVAWASAFELGQEDLAQLDTQRLEEKSPVGRPCEVTP